MLEAEEAYHRQRQHLNSEIVELSDEAKGSLMTQGWRLWNLFPPIYSCPSSQKVALTAFSVSLLTRQSIIQTDFTMPIVRRSSERITTTALRVQSLLIFVHSMYDFVQHIPGIQHADTVSWIIHADRFASWRWWQICLWY